VARRRWNERKKLSTQSKKKKYKNKKIEEGSGGVGE